MKSFVKTILLAAAGLCLASAAHGGGDRVGIYTDESATGCNLVDVGTQAHEMFVIFTGPSELSAVEFQLVPSDGAALTYMGEAIPGFAAGAMGRADTGVGIALGGCYGGETVLLLTVIYLGMGGSDTCSRLRIGPDPNFPEHVNGDKILFVTCGMQRAWADPGHLTVNPDDDCECQTDPLDQPSPVASTTWGGIKALYLD